jgi:hypothetical protein
LVHLGRQLFNCLQRKCPQEPLPRSHSFIQQAICRSTLCRGVS